MRMKKITAAFVGLLVSSAIPAAILSVAGPLSGQRDFPSIAVTFAVAYPFSAAATLLLGLPLFFVLHWLELVTWWTSGLGGFFIGVLIAFAIRAPNEVQNNEVWKLGAIGAISAFAFWIVWKKSIDVARQEK